MVSTCNLRHSNAANGCTSTGSERPLAAAQPSRQASRFGDAREAPTGHRCQHLVVSVSDGHARPQDGRYLAGSSRQYVTTLTISPEAYSSPVAPPRSGYVSSDRQATLPWHPPRLRLRRRRSHAQEEDDCESLKPCEAQGVS